MVRLCELFVISMTDQGVVPQIELSYLRLPALIFTIVPRNNFKTIANPELSKQNSVSSNRITNVAILSS